MLNKVLLCALLFFTLPRLTAQNEENGLVGWLSFQDAQEKNKIQNKPFLIDIYTDWCGWCKHQYSFLPGKIQRRNERHHRI
jgi:thiol-disulfide isomerase/thioredoxin